MTEQVQSDLVKLPRSSEGRFLKGNHYSRDTELRKGQHWRTRKPYWTKEELEKLYLQEQRSAAAIALVFGCTEANILYFLRKHGISTRTMKEIRSTKHWGVSGPLNPMFGKVGRLHPNWNGGHTPERQQVYAKYFWKELAKSILKRDNYHCTNCGSPHTTDVRLEVHHIKSWATHPELRFEPSNLTTLCRKCHIEVTSRGVKARKKK